MKNANSVIPQRTSASAIVLMSIIALGATAGRSGTDKPHSDLTVNRRSIHLGEAAELSWNMTGSNRAFLSHVGAVKNIGSEDVRPEQTTTYTLLADTPSGLIARSITVEVVNGRRGDEFSLNTEDFRYPRTATTKVSFIDLAVQVHSVLQDEMHLSVKRVEYDPDRARLVFLTSLAKDERLMKPSESKIGSRRVAYLVTIEHGVQDGTLDYTVKTLVEYRLRIEETWRPEQAEDLYTSSGDDVRHRIDSDLKSQELKK